VYKSINKRLDLIRNSQTQPLFRGGKIGLEKESLRVSDDGTIANTRHPVALGAALTHSSITTDYSEALLELITPPCRDAQSALRYLQEVQAFVYTQLDRELLWANSMPCIVSGERSIPVAQYGSSNAGKMKHIYRLGLGHRYGKMMQVIAGVHYNYSLPESFWPIYQSLLGSSSPLQDFISESYFSMIRNLQRLGWVVPYLFGTSPTVCQSFIDGIAVGLESFDDYTYYQPYATSLRVGDIGYQNYKEGKTGIKACYDNLDKYVASLSYAIDTPSLEYQGIGIKVNGKYRQLNSNILQIENEYYSTIRPKQIIDPEERPSLALKRRGVKYVELRSLDINPMDPMSVNIHQLNFLEAFLIFCLLQNSEIIDLKEQREIDLNLSTTAHHGRKPDLQLQSNQQKIKLKDWGIAIVDAMQGICEILDSGKPEKDYQNALDAQRLVFEDPDNTPSAKIIHEMRDKNEAFFPFSLRYSKQHEDYFRSIKLSAEKIQKFQELAAQSIEKQQQMEELDTLNFDEYLQRYYQQT